MMSFCPACLGTCALLQYLLMSVKHSSEMVLSLSWTWQMTRSMHPPLVFELDVIITKLKCILHFFVGEQGIQPIGPLVNF